MSKFKVGDEVKVIGPCTLPEQNIYIGKIFLIDTEDSKYDGEPSYTFSDVSYRFKESWLELVNSERDAISLLTSLGYTVTEPLPKLSGKAYVYHYPSKRDGQIYIYNDNLWEKYVVSGNGVEGKVLLAVVDWTEGDGI